MGASCLVHLCPSATRSPPGGWFSTLVRGQAPAGSASMDAMSALTMTSLNKTYGTVRALRDLSMEVRAGEIVGFVGSNGAGKSTTMRIVLGVLEADSGEVRWDGRPIDLDVRRRIGYMPEERGLYPRMKVGDQLVYLARLHGLDAVVGHGVDGALDRGARHRGAARRRGPQAVAGQPAARAAGRGARALPRDPGARRAVLRPRPRRGRRDERRAARPGRGGRAGAVLVAPARARRGAVRPRRHHQERVDGRVRRDRGAAPRPTTGAGWSTGRRAPSWVTAVPSAHVVSTRRARGRSSRCAGRPPTTSTRSCCARRWPPARCTSSRLLRPSLTELYRHVVSTDADRDRPSRRCPHDRHARPSSSLAAPPSA